MALINEFNERVDDINAYFNMLSFEDVVEAYKNKPIINSDQGQQLLVDNTMQKCMRANAVIMLYNLVESTFCNCIQLIYDAISDEHLNYYQVSDKLRKVWIGLAFDPDWPIDAIRRHAKDYSDQLQSSVLTFSDMPSGTSGNLDFSKMVEISGKFNINFGNVPNVEDVKTTLLYLKKNRNDLAHGNTTFSYVGANVSLSELADYRNHTIAFLQHCIGVYNQYVQQKKYRI